MNGMFFCLTAIHRLLILPDQLYFGLDCAYPMRILCTIDSTISFIKHICKTFASCSTQSLALRLIVIYVYKPTINIIACSHIITRL